MGFLSGRASFTRYRVLGRGVAFGPESLERLQQNAIGRQRVASADSIEAGWIAGDHILDTNFDLEKNVVNDTLQFALRIDALKIPGDLLRAYTQIELQGLASQNPSGLPSARQKREARLMARERLEKEAADGRFVRRRSYPLLWDSHSKELLVGTTASVALERLYGLFQRTFERKLEPVGAGRRAFLQAEIREQTRGVDDAAVTPFVPGLSPAELAWLPDESSRDFLGNEFLLWLWYVLDNESDTIAVSDGSEVTAMLARQLVLECPRGQTGRESIWSDGPDRLPEARRAIQAGKLPRQAGLTLARHGHTYEVNLHAESLAVTAAKLPAPEEEEPRAQLEERIDLLRHLVETLDLLYDAFGQRRFGAGWSKEAVKMQKWLQREERLRPAANG